MEFNVLSNDRSKGGIYIIRNLINDKIYIGGSVNFKRRYNEHHRDLLQGKHTNPKLQRSINKYGLENFTFSIVEVCCEDDIIKREEFWINELAVIDNGYNILATARGINKEARAKIAATMKLKPGFFTGKKHTAEANLQNSLKHKGIKPSPETVKKIVDTRKRNGYRHSEATRKKLADRRTGHPFILSEDDIKRRAATFKNTWAEKRILVNELCINCNNTFQKRAMYKNKKVCPRCKKLQ